MTLATIIFGLYLFGILLAFELIILVLLAGGGKLINKIFIGILTCSILWTLSSYLIYIQTEAAWALFWARATLLPTAWFAPLMIAFAKLFPGDEKLGFKNRAESFLKLWLFPIVLTIMTPTALNVAWIEPGFGGAWTPGYGYIFAGLGGIFYIVWSLYILFKKYRNEKDVLAKKQLLIVIAATSTYFSLFLLLSTILPYFVNPLIGFDISGFAPLATFFYTIPILYASFRHKLFNVRTIATQILVFALWFFLLIRIAFIPDLSQIFADIVLFVVALVGGIALVKLVLNEVEQREQQAILVEELHGFNTNLQEKINSRTAEVAESYLKEREARKELEALDYERTQFVLTAQHHLRTPLTITKGYLNEMISKAQQQNLDSKIMEAALQVKHDADDLGASMNALLNISEQESKQERLL